MHLEYRNFKLKIDAKSVTDDGTFATFKGYASTFGNEDAYGDVVDPGAFTKTIQEAGDTLPMLWQHDTDEVIGVYPSLAEDEHGLLVEGKISLETQRGREAYALLKMGAIKSMSIGFNTVKDVVDAGVRRLKEIRLWEISLVTFPANTAALVTGVKADGELVALVERLAARVEQLEQHAATLTPTVEGVDTDALLAEIRRLAEPHTHSAAADGTTDEKPDESHFKSLVMEMRSAVERDLQAQR